MAQRDLRQAFGETAEHVQERAPEELSLEWVQGLVERDERFLRLRNPEGLPERYEAELRSPMTDPSTMTGALRRLFLLKHLYRLEREVESRRPSHEDALEAARKLLTREPIIVEVCGERVEVTSRSYSAMAEIGMHELAIRRLDADLARVMRIMGQLHVRLRGLSLVDWRGRGHVRRRIQRLEDMATRIHAEKELHRARLYAHALTPDGAPAVSIEQTPPWWDRTTPEDDAKLLEGLLRVGPARYAALGKPPPPKKKGKAEPREDFGFGTLFSNWEPKLNLKPAELYDRDLAQTLTHLRAGALDLPEREG